MRLYQIVVLLAAFTLTGCNRIYENRDDCVVDNDNNLIVNFSNKDKDNNEVFASKIDHVELFVFDKDGLLVENYTVKKDDLKSFQGKKLKLDAGTYNIVCWANITQERSRVNFSKAKDINDQNHNYLENAIFVNGKIENGDPLYYSPSNAQAPLTVTVPKQGSVETTAMFRSAHIKLNITVKGFTNTGNPTDPPILEVSEMTPMYDFKMNTFGDKVTYQAQAKTIDAAKKTFNYTFNTPRFGNDNSIEIRVKNSLGDNVIEPLKLKDLINGTIDVTQHIELTIPILIEFLGGTDVNISLPGWGITDPLKPL